MSCPGYVGPPSNPTCWYSSECGGTVCFGIEDWAGSTCETFKARLVETVRAGQEECPPG